jgi:hypothetical protein
LQEVYVRFLSLAASVSAALLMQACSSQQLYGTGQEMQRNECRKIVDMQEQRRCMANANVSHDEYKRQSEAAKGAK